MHNASCPRFEGFALGGAVVVGDPYNNGESDMATASRIILTGVPAYRQDTVVKENGKSVIAGCGPTAALMLLAWYDRRRGYKRLVSASQESSALPDDLIIELRQLMHTVNDLKNGQEWGLTVPAFFHSGLDKYISDRYGKTKIETCGSSDLGVSLDDVFEKSVSLIRKDKPHVLLLDWQGKQGIFPNHYVVVVGFRKDNGYKKLIVNPGWGYNFHVVDMEDDSVKPVRLYWVDSIEKDPDGPADGHTIGPKDSYTWVKKDGKDLLDPDPYSASSDNKVDWRAADLCEELITGTMIRRNSWFD